MQHKTALGALLLSVAALPLTAGAQMVVHAVSGTVKTVDANTLRVALTPDNTAQFKIAPSPGPSLEFDHGLRSEAVDAAEFKAPGDFAVIYFYGDDSDRTAVALHDLGPGPFQKVQGTVTGFDKHSRAMTLKDNSGKSHTFNLSEKLIVDEDTNVAEGHHYSPHKGDAITVAYTPKNEAVFIRAHM